MNERETNDLLKLLALHKFQHHSLQPKACVYCDAEVYRQQNTPTVRWSRAVKTVLHPPMPVGIMLTVIFALICALAFTMNT